MSLLKRINKHHWYYSGLIILCSLPVILPLLKEGFFQSDDGEWMIIRFSAFYHALRDGQFPVRWLGRLNAGYGYPVANFLYPGFMYLAVLFKMVGFGFVATIKIILGLSLLTSSMFTYAWLQHRFTKWAAFVGSIVYLYVPYHLYDVYTRGSVGEVFALAVVPFILWQIERKSMVWQSMGIAMLILAHNTLAALFLPLIVVYTLICGYKKGQRIAAIFCNQSAVGLGLGLAAFFWIPALYDLQFTIFTKTAVSEWQNYFVDTALIGIFSLVLTMFFISAVCVMVLQKRNTFSLLKPDTYLVSCFMVLQVVVLFLSMPVSAFVWRMLPLSFIQFPFRVLSLGILSAAFLTAYGVSLLKEKTYTYIAGICCLLLVVLSAVPYVQPGEYFQKDEGMYATNEDTTTVKNEYMPKWVTKLPLQHTYNKLTGDHITVTSSQVKDHTYQFSVNAAENTFVTLHTVYFPGWQVAVDRKDVAIDYEKNGLIEFPLAKGEHMITASFVETPVRLFADAISTITLVYLVYIAVKRRNYEKN